MKTVLSKIYLLGLMMTAVMLAATSCGTSRRGATGSGGTTTYKPAPAPKHIDFSTPHEPTVNTLLREADTWIGTAYAYGGNDRNGVDCSGFVTQVYSRAFDIRLPRASWQQFEYCTPLTRDQLQEGDLVFFTVRGGSSIGHVGIYIGNDQMIHASSSKGVIISSLSLPYYTANYYGAGRIESYYAMVDRDRNSGKPVPETPEITAPEILTADEPVGPEPSYADAPKTSPSGKTTVTMVRIARTPKPQPATPAVTAQTPVEPRPVAPTATEEPESGLAELSEFFD